MHLQVGFQTRFSQCFDIIVPVNVVHVDVFAPIAPVHGVINSSLIFNSQLARHASSYAYAKLRL